MEAERKLRVSELIEQLGQRAADDELKRATAASADGRTHQYPAGGKPESDARQRLDDMAEQARNKRLSFCRNEERLTWLKKHPARRDALAGAVRKASEDLLAVCNAQKHQFTALLTTHDFEDDGSYLDFRCLAGNTFAGFTQCAEGQEYIKRQLQDDGPTGLLGAVFKGNSKVAAYLKVAMTAIRLGTVNPPMDALQKLLKDIPADAASRQLSVMLGAALFTGKPGVAGNYWSSFYRPLMEVLDGEVVRMDKVPVV